VTARANRVSRAFRALLAVLLLCFCGGCTFLANELTFLDCAGPVAGDAPDAPVTALRERP
jgi:hypothetical protein